VAARTRVAGRIVIYVGRTYRALINYGSSDFVGVFMPVVDYDGALMEIVAAAVGAD
jgi:hypothetical protein